MDAFEILGIRGNPKTQVDLVRLRKRSAKLQEYYLTKSRREDAKRVKWAFEQVQKNCKGSGIVLPEKQPAATVEEPPASPEAAAPAEPEAPVSRKRKAASAEEERRSAIREKIAARRQTSGNVVDDKAKRQEEIKERLAVKRIMKKVPVRSEEDCKKALAALVSASDGEEGSSTGRFCLLCPVSIERIKTAARGAACSHLQCFDLEAFLMSKATACPVCEAELNPPEGLVVDSFMTSVVNSVADDDANEIAVSASGAWTIVAAASSEDEGDGAGQLFMATPFAGGTPFAEDEEDEGEAAAEAARRAAEEVARRREAEEEKAARRRAAGERAVAEAVERKAEKERRAAEAAEDARKAEAARKAEKERRAAAAAEAARKAEENRKLKALLPFIPKVRAGRQKAAEAGRAAPAVGPAAPAEDDGPPPRLSTEDDKSYVVVELTRPMGIVFQANGKPWGGVGIRAFDDDGSAALHGRLILGDQLAGVDHRSAISLDVDACIGLISGSRGKTVKVTFFRGEVRHLYGKHRPSEAWIEGMLRRVGDGRLKPAPPLDRKPASKLPKRTLAMAEDSVGVGEDDADEDFSGTEEPPEKLQPAAGSSARAALPAALAACIGGQSLDADLASCELALMGFEGSDESLPRAVLDACVAANSADWANVESQDSWRLGALERLAKIVRGED